LPGKGKRAAKQISLRGGPKKRPLCLGKVLNWGENPRSSPTKERKSKPKGSRGKKKNNYTALQKSPTTQKEGCTDVLGKKKIP